MVWFCKDIKKKCNAKLYMRISRLFRNYKSHTTIYLLKFHNQL